MSNNLNKDADPNDVISLEALKKILLSSRSLKIEDADGNVAAFKGFITSKHLLVEMKLY